MRHDRLAFVPTLCAFRPTPCGEPTTTGMYATRDARRMWLWFHEIQTAVPLQMRSKLWIPLYPLDVG